MADQRSPLLRLGPLSDSLEESPFRRFRVSAGPRSQLATWVRTDEVDPDGVGQYRSRSCRQS